MSESDETRLMIAAGVAASAAAIAFISAVGSDDEKGSALADELAVWWFADGVSSDADPDQILLDLTRYCLREGVVGETLFRKAAAMGLHGLAGDIWRTAPPRMKFAYEVFARTAPVAHRARAESEQALGLGDGTPPAPTKIPLGDSIYERVGRSDEREPGSVEAANAAAAQAEAERQAVAKRKAADADRQRQRRAEKKRAAEAAAAQAEAARTEAPASEPAKPKRAAKPRRKPDA